MTDPLMDANMVAGANAEKAKRFVLELAKNRGLLDAIAEAFLKLHGIKSHARHEEARRRVQMMFDKVLKDFRNRSALAACIKHAHALWAYSDGLRALKRSFPADIPSDAVLRAFDVLCHAAENIDTHGNDKERGIMLLEIFLEEDGI